MKTAARRLLAPLALVAALAGPASATATPNLFHHDLGLVDGHLRIAIEYAPEELGEALRSADLVCNLGERTLSLGEADLASADWMTLEQLVDQMATGAAHRVQVAFGNADSVLADLRARWEERWAGARTQLRELRRGVAATRRGIATMRAVIAGLETPFGSWHAHECAAATRGVEHAFSSAPEGLEQINVGMLRLWRLAELPPPRTEGG